MKNSILVPVLLGCLLAMPLTANAAWPEHTVHILVPTAPGGGIDSTARLLAGKLTEMWHQPVVVENRPGADGAIVYNEIAHDNPDGYELAWIAQNFTVLPSQHQLSYDPLKDFAPISLMMRQPDLLLVNSNAPVSTFAQFVDWVKSKPGQLNYGSAGVGSPQFLEMEKLMQATGLRMLHIGYQGGAGPAQLALLGGDIQVLFQPVSTVLGQVQTGKMKALAITGTSRSALMPDVPTGKEAANTSALDDGGVWYGLAAPAGTSADIVNKIRDDIASVTAMPDVKHLTDGQGLEAIVSTPAEFAQMLRDDIQKEAQVMKSFQPQK